MMMQHPVYFVSSLLQGARSRYSGVQKLLFGLLMASRKLRHYFQAHEITVVTRLLLQWILHNPDATGRIVEWALELSCFGLKFETTSTIQSRVLAEFIAEWTSTPDEEIQETTFPGKEARTGSCTLTGLSRCKAPVLVCCSSHPPESTSSM